MTPNPRSINKFSLTEHIQELRARCVWAIGFWCVATMVFGIFYSEAFLLFLIKPLYKIVFTHPAEVFSARISLSVLGGTIVSLPIWGYHLWRFVSCGLTSREKNLLAVIVPSIVVMFFLGTLFAHYVILSPALQFFFGFASYKIRPMITVEQYISFWSGLVIGFGCGFQIPIVMIFLGGTGFVTRAIFVKFRRFVYVGVFVFAAILTPPDWVTQVAVAIPMVVLFEASLVIIMFLEKHRRKESDMKYPDT